MVLGARRSSFVLSPQAQLQAYISYDPITRRKVRFIETIVPVLSSDDDIPADKYYFGIGAGMSPEWISIVNNLTVEIWDATDLRQYAEFDAADNYTYSTQAIAYPTGVHGQATEHAPKNGDVTKLKMTFRAAFLDNVDYTVYGVGLISGVGAKSPFNDTADHFIQVLRNAGNWELGTCDGATISQSSAAGGDADYHDFRVEWEPEVRLYVDDDLLITKSTNLPARALYFNAVIDSASTDMRLVDVVIEWV